MILVVMMVIIQVSASLPGPYAKVRGISDENIAGLESVDTTATGALYYANGIFCCGKGNVRNCSDYPYVNPCP